MTQKPEVAEEQLCSGLLSLKLTSHARSPYSASFDKTTSKYPRQLCALLAIFSINPTLH